MDTKLTLVITVLNEARNIRPVCEELKATFLGQTDVEILFVDDGSSDNTVAALCAFRDDKGLPLRVISHDKQRGKSAALRTGIEAARGQWIATMDGDGQDDPSIIPEMLRRAESCAKAQPSPLVVGVRLKRSDRLSRRVATKLANALRQSILKDGCPDTGAPMKLFARAAFLRIPQFEGVHRFLPALLGAYGARLICVETRHRSRLHGRSKYTNLNRALVGIRDLLGVMWLINRTRLPRHVTER